jgi:mRNA interferase MazF
MDGRHAGRRLLDVHTSGPSVGKHTSLEQGQRILVGSEIRKTRPCLIVSPDELNQHLRTIIVAPMTTGGHAYPFRPACRFGGKDGRVALDQIRTVDRDRLGKRLGVLAGATLREIFSGLAEMFEFS